MKIAICDDEKIMHDLLKKDLEKYSLKRGIVFIYDDFFNGSDIVASSNVYDIIFMDYLLKDTDGLKITRHLREKKVDSTIIFLSGYPNIVFDTFEVNAYRFLLKPINETKLYAALDDYLRSIDNSMFILIKIDDGSERINTNNIIYAEAYDKYCYIRTTKKNFLYKKTLSEFEKLLPKDRFIRSHRSYLVGFRHIVSHTSTRILFDNKEMAMISKHRLTAFKSAFIDYIKKRSIEGMQS